MGGKEPLPQDGGQHRPAPVLTRRRTRPQAGCRSAAGADLVQARSKRRVRAHADA